MSEGREGEGIPRSGLGQSPGARGDSPYELYLAALPSGHVRVDAFRGEERLNAPWWLEVTANAPGIGEELSLAVGGQAAFVMRTGAGERVFSGMVAAVRVVGHDSAGDRVRFCVRVVSSLWALRFRRRSRVFQNMRVDAIVGTILSEANVEATWNLRQIYPVREYCTQYEESDGAFIARLLAENGIAVRHQPPELRAPEGLFGGDRLYFGDDAAFYEPIGHAHGDAGSPRLRWLGASDAGSMVADGITHFEPEKRLRTNAATYWEYDPERPNAVLSANARLPGSGELGAGGGGASGAGGHRAELEHYEHHGQYHFRKWEFGLGEPERILRQRRRRADVAKGKSWCSALVPGGLFRLDDHPLEALNKDYAVVRVRHEGAATTTEARRESYRNRFECVPSGVVYCPARPRTRTVLTTLTATVVGGREDELFTDELGRIKVQFHWDRAGKRDQHSSCWLRTMQSWSGEAWGAQFIPRVGMEVVVAFDGGDPDKPLVLGALYNATHPLPFGTALEKTRSGFRTRSTPRSDGYNELSFDDAAGREEIRVHAERDLVEVVGHDRASTVGHNEVNTVAGDQTTQIAGSQSTRVTGARRFETLGAESVRTLGDCELHVGGERLHLVGGDERRTIDGDELVTVNGRALHTVAGGQSLRVGENYSVSVGSEEMPGTLDLYSWGSTMLGSGFDVSLSAERRIVLKCGESSIEVGSDEVRIRAPKLRLDADRELVVCASDSTLKLDGRAELAAKEVRLFSAMASLELDEHAHLDGQLVKLACGAGVKGEVTDDEGQPLTRPLRLKLADAHYEAYGNKEFVVRAGGARIEGRTGADGAVDVAIPIDAQVAELTVWLGQRPGGPTRHYTVELTPVEPADSVVGVQQRLRHLGYYYRSPSGELDAVTRHALEAFQREHGIDPTGELDDATRATLGDAHGN